MEKYLVLKASAGSGKTFALTVRYISLLLKGAKQNEILTLTFTNKAASEMSQRIHKTLLSLGEDEVYLEQIKKESGLSKAEILEKKSSLLESYTSENLSIYTIDKFINKILREFCGYIGISDDFEIKEDDLESLSMKFLNSLSSSDFNLLVDFALYEKKKFNNIFELFKYILEKNITKNIENDLSKIHIKKSYIDLQKQKVLDEGAKIKEKVFKCTQASNAVKKAVSFDSFEELFVKTWLEKDTLASHSYFKKCVSDELEEHFQNLKNELKNYYDLRATYSLIRLFKLYKSFEEFKYRYNKNKNYLEFNDVLSLAYDLVENRIDKDFIYFRLDSKFSHILIDEFQDTSLLQYKILKPLIDEILSGETQKFKTFFYVGDSKQAIYRFRGGKKELFDEVLKSNSILKTKELNINYRSSKNIIDFVNSVFTKVLNYEYVAQDFSQNSKKEGGFVEVKIDENLENKEKMFLDVAQSIKTLLDSGLSQNDIAVLTYTNDDVLNLYNFLKKEFPKLKITTEMTSKLINQNNVKAVINAIKYLFFKEKIYLENLNTLRGKPLNTPFEYSINLEDKKVEEIISKIADYLHIVDENVLRFMQLCSSYINIVDFIYEVDKQDSTIENSEQTGVQILTIFKSKGLDFHTVILLDRIKRKNPDRSSLLFDYENIELKRVFYKIKNYDLFSQKYSNAKQKEKNLELEDEKNIIYVALTRAIYNMIIHKKSKNSVFDLVDLKECKIGNIEIGEKSKKDTKQAEKILYKPLYLGTQEKQIDTNKNLDENQLYARYFGIATHYCLEMMNSFDKNSLKIALKLTKSRYFNFLSSDDFDDIENRVNQLLEDKKFINIVSGAKILSEQSLLYKKELKIIDLLVYKDGKYYIFDYKTTNNKDFEHKTQVSYYKEAISTIFETNKVSAYLIYMQKTKLDIDEV